MTQRRQKWSLTGRYCSVQEGTLQVRTSHKEHKECALVANSTACITPAWHLISEEHDFRVVACELCVARTNGKGVSNKMA